MKNIEVGDIVSVKNCDYGTFIVQQLLPNGYKDKKCRMVKLLHSSTFSNSDKTIFEGGGMVRYYRLIDVKFVRKPNEKLGDINFGLTISITA
ncbi:MAG: hypothetical protein CTY33_00150 [Methylotenera sp.]|nr:MAG: hypothetical protein CTY33_00150 [Methylotenera sp.]